MIKLPYNNADFYHLITNGYYYVDRTDRIALIEEMGRAIVFLRPRRFGKSLLLSMLENYYDVKKADEFDRLFGHLAIGKTPTPLHNQYFILKWDFSDVNTIGDIETIQTTLYDLMNESFKKFALRYASWLQHEIAIYPTNAIASFHSLLTAVSESSAKLYLLIDEYDNFANEVMMSTDPKSQQRYDDLVQGEGLLKVVFKSIKAALAGAGLDRVFITGVSPVVMSDLTSGFNVSRNITFHPALIDVCGFREPEVATILHDLVHEHVLSPDHYADALPTMRTFYNGYRFSADTASPLLYNPTLVFYFLQHMQESGTIPKKILDTSMAIDRKKLVYIAHLAYGKEIIAQAVHESNPLVIPELEDRFSVYDMIYGPKTTQFVLTLLYYLGVLTLTGQSDDWDRVILTIPNQVTQQLYFDQIREMVLTTSHHIQSGMNVKMHFHQTNDLEELCDFLEQEYFRLFSNRDYAWMNELSVKAVFMSLLHDTAIYVTKSEVELDRGYCDVLMRVRPSKRAYRFQDYLFEFKYLSLTNLHLSGEAVRGLSRANAANLPKVQAALTAADSSIRRYRDTVQQEYDQTLRLRCYIVVALGYDRLVWREVV